MIEAAILLQHENDVVQDFHGLIHVECRGRTQIAVHRKRTSACALAGAAPTCEIRTVSRCDCQFHAAARGEWSVARGFATDPCRTAGDCTGTGAGHGHGQRVTDGGYLSGKRRIDQAEARRKRSNKEDF